jgi:alpha/beta superfamily hydrolase
VSGSAGGRSGPIEHVKPPEPRPVTVVAGTRRLDARLHEPAGTPRGSLVFGHPHPLHGGNMDHPVVVAAAERAAAAGLLALRWDVGGVRASEGDRHDAEAHREDLRACARDLLHRVPEKPLFGGGFSYGGRLFAAVVVPDSPDRPPFAGGLLLAPATHVPSSARDFGNLLLGRPLADAGLDPRAVARLRALPVPVRVIVGERDVVAPPEELRSFLPATATLEVLPGLNHFFSRAEGAGTTARDLLLPALDRALGALCPPPSPAR